VTSKITRENVLQAQEVIQEAGKKRRRAIYLMDEGDHSGSVEASQHCVELAVKSLFIVSGLPYCRIHDPGRELDKVTKTLKEAFPLIAVIPVDETEKESFDEARQAFREIFDRMKLLSRLMSTLHTDAMYGYNKTVASKIFTKRDSEYFSHCALEVHFLCVMIVLGVGFLSSHLPQRLREGIQAFLRFVGSFPT
jgi:HEPN domain-containing protein